MKGKVVLVMALLITGCTTTPIKTPQPVTAIAPTARETPPPSQFGLGPFGLGMPIDEAMKAVKAPAKTGVDEHGGAYWAFPVSPSGGYMVVLVAPFRPAYVYGAQISGGSDVDMDSVLGLKLGDPEGAILAKVGEPTSKTKEDGIDRTLWAYDGRNYSFEIDSTGHLVSILVYGYAGVITAKGWEANWERYIPNSIKAVLEQDKEGLATLGTADIYIAAGGVAFRPRVIFTGDIRDTDPATKELITDWLKSMRSNLDPNIYSKSIRVTEDGTDYWLPTQAKVVEAIQQEVKPGEAIDLFAMWLGAKDKGKTKAFFVNDYCSCSWVPIPKKG